LSLSFRSPFLLFLILLISCDRSDQDKFRFARGYFDEPPAARVDVVEGYRINPATGDSILPLITPTGEPARTGKPIPAAAFVLNRDSLEEPREIPLRGVEVVPVNLPVHPVAESLTTFPVSFAGFDQLPERGPYNFPDVIINSIGDTVLTGKPIRMAGEERSFAPGQPVFALPPGMKDNATRDIKYLDVYHGLYSSQVISMMEDRFGRIWFGTGGGGVSVYDGQSFTNLTREEGLCESMILSMIEDSRGNIWLGSNGEGLIMFDGRTFTHYREENGLISNTIQDIHEDRQGNIWFTQGGGICRFSGENMIHYSRKEGLFSRGIEAIMEDDQGNIWLGTQEGIILYDGQEFRRLEGLPRFSVKAILEGRDGSIWFGTYGRGLLHMQGEELTFLGTNEGLSNDQVESIVEDAGGNLWIGTAGGGVSMFDGKAFTYLTSDNGLSGQWIVPILEDGSGNLWFGSMGGGVSIYNRNSFRHFTENEGLSIRAIFSMLEDHQGNLWFGTLFGGVNRYDGDSFTRFTVRSGLNDPTVESILEDREGNIWFGLGDRGVSKYDGRTFTNFGRRVGFTNSPVGAMVEDGEGRLWFATLGGGLISYDGEAFSHFTDDGGLINNFVETVIRDREGNLWLGSLGGGVCRFDGSTFTHYTQKEGLSSNYVGCLFEDSRGMLWIGTMDRGAMMLEEDTITYFTERQGISDNYIQSIMEDRLGNIWLSTDKGLNVLRFDQGNQSFQIRTYGLQEGLKGINFFQNSVLLDSHNRMWWGNSKSLTMLNMNTFNLDDPPPSIEIDRVDLNRRMTDYRIRDRSAGDIRYDSVVPFFNVPVNLQLPYSENHLTFHFLGIDWSAPQKIRFSCMVEGVDKEWSLPRIQPFAEYRNLPYGTHVFKVRAKGTSGEWSDPVAFTFTVLRPWWNTWLARIGFLLAAVLMITLLFRWRTSLLKRRQRELEKIVHDRTEEISEMVEELKQQNVSLASQRDEIQAQKDQIQHQNQAITDSIEYAKRIQTATLPPDEVLKYLLPKHFILYKPLNIVSGDFYWLAQKRGKLILAVADCTGHGVPGAFMSMLGSALLNEVVSTIGELKPDLILNELRDQVIRALRQTGESDEARDGMDIALCVIDLEGMNLQFAGAHHPLYHVRAGKLTDIKSDPMPIGISSEAGKSFTSHEVDLVKNDTIYLFSDGYADQLGGERRRRFMTSRFKNLLLQIQDQIMYDQKRVLEARLKEWMDQTPASGKRVEQIDDILVVGIRF
jgi:ligand-binding sensor domain-containing protein/serine phosphatase RsbU (regulator of sigma subunit)